MFKKIILSIVFVSLSITVLKLNAASLSNFTVVSSIQNESSLTNIIITFTPNTPITNNSDIIVSYDTLFTGGNLLVNSDINISATNINSASCSGFIVGFFICTISTSGAVNTPVTINVGSVNQLTTPSSEGNYSFAVSVDIGGLGSTVESGSGLAYISSDPVKENELLITAYVPPNLSLEIFEENSSIELNNPNACTLGVLSISSVKSCRYNLGVGTNNVAGASVTVSSDGLFRNGTTNFISTTGTISAGTESYGFYVSNQGNRFSILSGYEIAYKAVPIGETLIASSSQTSNLLSTLQHITVTHSASISSITEVGNYSHKIVYRAYTN